MLKALLVISILAAPAGRAADVPDCTSGSQECVPLSALTSPFRERLRNLQRRETATFQTLLRDTRRYLLSNMRGVLQNKGTAPKETILNCFMHLYDDCQGKLEGLTKDGRRWLNLAKIRVFELMTLEAANSNPANELGVEGVLRYAKEGIDEAKQLIRNSSDEPVAPLEPPPPPQIDSAWDKCLIYTFACAGQCAASGGATPACDPDLVATQSLSRDLDSILALSGTHVPSVTMGLRYLQKLRETALLKLIRAHGQTFGHYRAFHAASGEDVAACSSNPAMWDFVNAETGQAMRAEDAEAFKVTSTSAYRLQAARGAADVVRNLFRREYFKQFQTRYQNGGVSFPGAIGMTENYVADPDCACLRDKLRIGTRDIGSDPDGVFQSSAVTSAVDTCTPVCCGASGPDASLKNLPGGTNGSCAAWTTFPVRQREAAEAEIRRTLRNFPILAAGSSNHDEMFDWTSPSRTFPKVSRLFHALYTPRIGTDSAYDPAFADRSAKQPGDPAEIAEAYESALQAAGRDFGAAVSRFCKASDQGGLKWDELVTLPDLAADVVAGQPMYASIQECGVKAAASSSSLKAGATAVAGLGCLVLGIASAGVGAPACGVAFAGLALADYQDAARRSFLLGPCASAGAGAGICSASDAAAAEEERVVAGYMAAAAVAFAVVDVAVAGPQTFARARDAYRRIQAARGAISREGLVRLTAELDAAGGAGAAAAARRLEAIAAEAEELAAVSGQASRVSKGIASFRTISAEERALARARILQRLESRLGSGVRGRFPCLF